MTGSPPAASCILGRRTASMSNTQGGSRVPKLGLLGSVRGVRSNAHPYRKQNRSIHVYGRRSRRRRAAGGPKRVGDGPEIVTPKRTSVGYGTQPPAWFTVTRTPNARTVATPGQITRAAIPALTYV